MHRSWFSDFRHRLADSSSLIQMSLVGILSGFGCALVILAFRFAIEMPSASWLPNNDADNFEALPTWLHFALPLAGAILLGLILSFLKPEDTRTGTVHVLTRLHAHHGHLPLKNALVQFFGGAFAIATGQSGGREGPAIHLGSATSSLIGQKLQLPNNSIRMMIGCGTAAAIAASFNTPIAGVIFAMEVIMMEYTVAGFIPVMLSAVIGTTMTRLVYGSEQLFTIPPLQLASLWELPYIALIGVVIGCFAAAFNIIIKITLRFSEKPIAWRFTLAGLITASCALLAPEVLGIGYDSLNDALSNQLPLNLLLILIVVKITATATSTGLGLPIGLIGPNLLIGACIGSAMGILSAHFFPNTAGHHSFYVLLGMGAMMGAVLNAPLAALMALMELANNTAMIFPGMLAITIATLINREVFKQRSAHQTVLQYMQQNLATDPISLALQRTSVATVMQRSLSATPQTIPKDKAEQLIENNSLWYIVTLDASETNNSSVLIRRRDILPQLQAALTSSSQPESESFNLLELAVRSQPVVELPIQATLHEALMTMDQQQVDALHICGYISGPYPGNGILMRDDIENYSRTPQVN